MKINIKHIAKLANLHPSEALEKKLEKQLEETLVHVQRLNEIDTSKVAATNDVTGLQNVFHQDDELEPPLPQKKALQGTEKTHNGFFIVKAILTGE